MDPYNLNIECHKSLLHIFVHMYHSVEGCLLLFPVYKTFAITNRAVASFHSYSTIRQIQVEPLTID